MKINKILQKFMHGFKNAKLSHDLHQRLKVFAATEGLQIGLVIEAACELGLREPEKLRRLAEAHTTQARNRARDG